MFENILYILIIIMPKFNNGKITSSVIFYNRGVPPRSKNFGTLASLNYSVLKQLAIYNKQQGRSVYSFM
jgi:hypothetical protein